MSRALVTFAVIGLPTLLAGLGMWRGYAGRRARDEHDLAPLPTVARPDRAPDALARYTGTTRGGNWVERVAAGGLFGRGPCALWADADGLTFHRQRGPVVRAAPIVAVNLERAHAGQLAPPGRLVVVRWRHRRADGTGVEFDSGFLTRSREDARRLVSRLGQGVGA